MKKLLSEIQILFSAKFECFYDNTQCICLHSQVHITAGLDGKVNLKPQLGSADIAVFPFNFNYAFHKHGLVFFLSASYNIVNIHY